MKRGQVVAKRYANYQVGAVLDSQVRPDGWKYLEVQWITLGEPPIPAQEKAQWLRHDALVMLDPIEELKRYHNVVTLSSALLSENYERVLKNEYEID